MRGSDQIYPICLFNDAPAQKVNIGIPDVPQTFKLAGCDNHNLVVKIGHVSNNMINSR